MYHKTPHYEFMMTVKVPNVVWMWYIVHTVMDYRIPTSNNVGMVDTMKCISKLLMRY